MNSTAVSQTENETGNALAIDGKTLQAFDQLATLVNARLDYPEMLAENGVQGLAKLDLYFDHSARIDESRTHIVGDNSLVRGLLVRATRKALVEWFESVGGRLEKEKFRDQHFRADFIITFTSPYPSDFRKEGEGSYHFIRRSLVQTCLNPALHGLDLACAAARIAGAISNQVSAKYKIRYQALTDELESLDQLDINGINAEIASRA